MADTQALPGTPSKLGHIGVSNHVMPSFICYAKLQNAEPTFCDQGINYCNKSKLNSAHLKSKPLLIKIMILFHQH